MNRAWSLLDACRAQRGMVLPLTLMILVVLSAMVLTLLALGIFEPQIAANVLRGAQSLALAEAGAERAIAHFVADSSSVNNACDPACPAPVTATALFGGSQSFENLGTYQVTWKPVSFATVLIESTGKTSNGAVERTVRVAVTKHYSPRYGVLGDKVEVKGSGRVIGNFGGIHGNTDTRLDGAALVQKTATTTSSGTCTGCDVACTVANCSTAANPPANAKGVGITSGSGAVGPVANFPRSPSDNNLALRPYDYLSTYDFTTKPAVIFGGRYTADGSGDVPAPAACAGVTTTVPEKQVLVVTPSGCTLYKDPTESSGTLPALPSTYGNWRMHGSGEWELSGNTTPPEGFYYAPKRIKVTGNVGATGTTADEFANAWKATLVAGSPREEGRVELKGNTTIKPYLDDVLTVAGEIKAEGSSLLKGTLIGTAPGDGASLATCPSGQDCTDAVAGDGKVEVKGNAVKLRGNVISNGKARVEGEVKYQVSSRTRLLSTTLVILSWTAN